MLIILSKLFQFIMFLHISLDNADSCAKFLYATRQLTDRFLHAGGIIFNPGAEFISQKSKRRQREHDQHRQSEMDVYTHQDDADHDKNDRFHRHKQCLHPDFPDHVQIVNGMSHQIADSFFRKVLGGQRLPFREQTFSNIPLQYPG